jgi:isoamylase
LLEFTRQLIAFRLAHPVFRRRRFLAGAEASELRWFTPGGGEMTAADWSDASALAVALYLDGSDDPDRAADGAPLLDDDFLVLVNAWWEPLDFVLPVTRPRAAWHIRLDTYNPASAAGSGAVGHHSADRIAVGPRSIVVLSNPRLPE